MAQTSLPRTTSGFLGAAWSALKAIPVLLGTLGESGIEQGSVWEYRFADATRRRLSATDDLAYPIAGRNEVVAIQGQHLVQLGANGTATPIPTPKAEWTKLIVVTPEGILALVGYDAPRPILLTTDGRLQEISPAATPEERSQLGILQFESRRYATGDLRIGTAARGGGTDIFFVHEGRIVNVSDAGPGSAGHPFIASDGTRVFYIVGRR